MVCWGEAASSGILGVVDGWYVYDRDLGNSWGIFVARQIWWYVVGRGKGVVAGFSK